MQQQAYLQVPVEHAAAVAVVQAANQLPVVEPRLALWQPLVRTDPGQQLAAGDQLHDNHTFRPGHERLIQLDHVAVVE